MQNLEKEMEGRGGENAWQALNEVEVLLMIKISLLVNLLYSRINHSLPHSNG